MRLTDEDENSERLLDVICPTCYQDGVGRGIPFQELLDRFRFPVLLVTPQVEVLYANAAGRESPELKLVQSHNVRLGEAFECRYARLPNGCGASIHCKSCTIRRTISSTYHTGTPHIRVPAYMDRGDELGDKSVRHLISTKKLVDMILLYIEEPEAA